MRKAAAIALALAGLGAAAAVVLAMAPAREMQPPPEPAPAIDRAAGAASPSPVAPARSTRVRAVSPEVVAPPEVAAGELERVEPRRPLGTVAAQKRRPKNHGMIFRPVADAAGRVTGSGLTIEFPGIVPTEPERMCTDGAGVRWPCGARARGAFRAFLRGRALRCDLPDEVTASRYSVACALGQQDVAGWLVAQGWAEAAPGGPYAAAGESARRAGKGIHGAAPVIEPLPDPRPFVSALPEPPAPPSAVE